MTDKFADEVNESLKETGVEFLPEGYEIPNKAGSYMKFVDGENRIRILGSAIIGWEYWKTAPDGTRKPVRVHMKDPINTDELEDEEKVKHFWAMPVYNYKEEKIQILEITQKGIQKSIKALAKDKDWGSPIGYDLVITKTGQKLETEYQVQPKPAKELEKGIVEAYKGMFINLDALYLGEDPFEKVES